MYTICTSTYLRDLGTFDGDFLKQSGVHSLNASNSLQGGGLYQNIII